MPLDRAPDEAQFLIEREAAEVYFQDPFRELALAAVIDIYIYDHRPASSRDLQSLVEHRSRTQIVLHSQVCRAGRRRNALDLQLTEHRARLAIERHHLKLRNLRKLAVVEDAEDRAESQPRSRDDFESGHQECPVADYADHLLVGMSQLHANRARHTIAHAVEVRR